MSIEYAPPLEETTGNAPDASVIWLHGLGADGYDFLPIVRELRSSGLPPTRFVFPHAPTQAVTLNGGYVMPAWYDIVALNAAAPEDEAGLRRSIAYIERLIEHEVARGVDSRRIVLAGFSQGGNVALNCALRATRPLAGALILSSYLGLQDKLAEELSIANRGLPIFMAHGSADEILPLAWGENARETLRALDYPVQWVCYPMGHTVCAEEVAAIGRWLADVFAASP